jgi:hypothetical protein
MLKCCSCHELFDEIIVVKGEKVCPHCLDFDFEEAKQCEKCKAWFFEDEIENVVCEECEIDLIKEFQSLIVNNFTETERKILNEIYDGKEF